MPLAEGERQPVRRHTCRKRRDEGLHDAKGLVRADRLDRDKALGLSVDGVGHRFVLFFVDEVAEHGNDGPVREVEVPLDFAVTRFERRNEFVGVHEHRSHLDVLFRSLTDRVSGERRGATRVHWTPGLDGRVRGR